MTTNVHLAELTRRHRELEKQIIDALAHASTDELKITELKRQKLHLKDEIERLRAAPRPGMLGKDVPGGTPNECSAAKGGNLTNTLAQGGKREHSDAAPGTVEGNADAIIQSSRTCLLKDQALLWPQTRLLLQQLMPQERTRYTWR